MPSGPYEKPPKSFQIQRMATAWNKALISYSKLDCFFPFVCLSKGNPGIFLVWDKEVSDQENLVSLLELKMCHNKSRVRSLSTNAFHISSHTLRSRGTAAIYSIWQQHMYFRYGVSFMGWALWLREFIKEELSCTKPCGWKKMKLIISKHLVYKQWLNSRMILYVSDMLRTMVSESRILNLLNRNSSRHVWTWTAFCK